MPPSPYSQPLHRTAGYARPPVRGNVLRPREQARRAERGRGIRGELGSDGDGQHSVTVARAFDDNPPREHPREPIEELDGGVFYVDLSNASIEDFRERLESIAAAPGAVFDLRGYPKGNHDVILHLIDEPVESARWNGALRADHRGRTARTRRAARTLACGDPASGGVDETVELDHLAGRTQASRTTIGIKIRRSQS